MRSLPPSRRRALLSEMFRRAAHDLDFSHLAHAAEALRLLVEPEPAPGAGGVEM